MGPEGRRDGGKRDTKEGVRENEIDMKKEQGGDKERRERKKNKKRRPWEGERKRGTGRPRWACERQPLFDARLKNAKNTANAVWTSRCFLYGLHISVCVLWVTFLHG